MGSIETPGIPNLIETRRAAGLALALKRGRVHTVAAFILLLMRPRFGVALVVALVGKFKGELT